MSFTEAAEELGVTQAAVSQQVRQLEDWLGTQLFKRLPRALALTDAGIAYLPTVRDTFDRLHIGTEQIFGRLDRRPVRRPRRPAPTGPRPRPSRHSGWRPAW